MIKKAVISSAVLALLVSFLMPPLPVLAAPPTTSITITRYAADGATVLEQTTVGYEWMMDNLPVQGDGVTHYYHQGPTFDYDNLWDPEETVNTDSRDMGPVRGTDVKDLCELLPGGGAVDGDEIEIKSSDGFGKTFAYEDVYSPEPAQGKMVVCWYNADYGYIPDYDTGMRLVFFAETTSADGKHVFGNWDMHETLAEDYWHYYVNRPDFWPSSGGLSVKWVDRINIISKEEIPEGAADSPAITTDMTRQSMGMALDRSSINLGSVSSTELNIFNIGNTDIDVTLQVSTADSAARSFYTGSLYINDNPYNMDDVIASVETGRAEPVNIRLVAPADTAETDLSGTRFIFWAEAGE